MKKTAKQILEDAKLEKSYWGRRLIAAEERGKFNILDCQKSGEWTTCACGLQDPRIPRDDYGAPIDKVLGNLGCEFSGLVIRNGKNFQNAAQCLVSIEKRASEILEALA